MDVQEFYNLGGGIVCEKVVKGYFNVDVNGELVEQSSELEVGYESNNEVYHITMDGSYTNHSFPNFDEVKLFIGTLRERDLDLI